MATERKRMLLGGSLNGWPLMHQLEEFTPVSIEKEMEAAQGGRFAPEQLMVGLKQMECEVTLMGAGYEIVIAQGIGDGDTVELDVRESQEDLEGIKFAVWHLVSGTVTKVDRGNVKMKEKPSVKLTISPVRTAMYENGITLHNINLRTQVIDLGSGDIMEAHRRNILMP